MAALSFTMEYVVELRKFDAGYNYRKLSLITAINRRDAISQAMEGVKGRPGYQLHSCDCRIPKNA